MKRLLFTLFIALCGLSASAEEIRYMCIEQTNGTVTKLPVSTIARISFVLENVDPTPVSFAVTLLVNDATMGSVSGAGAYPEGATATFTATANSGYRFVRWSDGETTNPRMVLVSEDITLTAIFEQQSGEGFNGHAYVDLGLPSGTLWATCNVGATNPEDYGDYFAWGETSPKKDSDGNYTAYDWSIYKYCNGSYLTQTKYCTDSYGTVDNKTVLEAADDAATANWGGDWRMPTKVEQDELRTECAWTWTTLNGENGYEVKGTNGNSIFLPTAGYRNDSGLGYVGNGIYWSSSLYEYGSCHAYVLNFSSDGHDWYNYYDRYYGLPVRPVCSSR